MNFNRANFTEKFKNYFGNFTILAVIVFVLSKQIPMWRHSYKQIGKDFFKIEAVSLNGEETVVPEDEKKKVYIFWATWCGPCHLQLAQFEKAVAQGELPKDQVVAVRNLKDRRHDLYSLNWKG